MVRFASFFLRLPQVINPSASKFGRVATQYHLLQRYCSIHGGGGSEVVPSLLEADVALKLFNGEQLTPGASGIKFIDGSWHLDKARNPVSEFESEHIPGARYFDINAAADQNTTLPHMIPSPDEFANYVTSLNITSDDHVIVYGTQGCFSSARVWWTFRAFGHDKVSVLNGGLPAWKALNGPVESGAAETTAAPRSAFSVPKEPLFHVDWQKVMKVVETGSSQILDARSKGRFLGEAPEPRPGLAGGHIPGSLCLPFNQLLKDGDVTTFKSVPEIRDALTEAGIVVGSNVVCSCGSGVTASVLFFGLHLIGVKMDMLAVYDGSWAEWGSRGGLPIINPAKSR